MSPRQRIIACLACSLAALLPASALALDENPAGQTQPAATFADQVRPVFEQFCTGCHGGDDPMAGMALDRFDEAALAPDKSGESVAKDRHTWEKVLLQLRDGVMPPPDNPRPSDAELAAVLDWIETNLRAFDCSGTPDPGRVTIRRLNRAEYNNTIRDLVGVDFSPADDFPSDDVGYGFDHIGDVLSLPPILLEKYLAAAEEISRRAITVPDPPARQRFDAATAQQTGDGEPRDSVRILTSTGEVFVPDAQFGAAGQYVLRAKAYGQQAGDEPARMAFRLDGSELELVDVPARRRNPGVYETRVQVDQPGAKRFAVAFVNDYYRPDDPNPRNRDRNLIVEHLEVEGPLPQDAAQASEIQQRIIFVSPPPGDRRPDAWSQSARQVIERFATRAYRRPVEADEAVRLARLVEMTRADGETFERGIQLAVQAVLVSPHFLFRVELVPQADSPAAQQPETPAQPDTAPQPITEHQLATRLSYFLWSSMPDDELFAHAAAGTLRQNIAEQTRRMLKDPKSRALVDNFAGQWLQIRRLNTMTPDRERFPVFDDALRDAMLRETELFFAAIKDEDRSVLEFLNADFTFLNERLARHYGIDGVAGDDFRRVSLAGGVRGGVLTQASILTITSNPTRTSPVKRGKWILEQILGTPAPPPPPGVEELEEGDQAALSGTLRQRMEQHRENPSCASCHSRMDPLGFGLENFDAVGAWRDREGTFEIDASAELADGSTFNGPAELKAVLAGKPDQFARALTEHMLTYALGRGLEYYDRCAVDAISEAVANADYKFSALVLAVVQSDPFQLRRGGG
ncbi:MAG: DUF1592 domain-containing protein [Pirellulales bacterium]